MVKVRVAWVVAWYWMCGRPLSREPYSERLPVFDGYESACTTSLLLFRE